MKGMVNVCTGEMSLDGLSREIAYYMLKSKPSKCLVVKIKRKKMRYYVTIYIPKKDFDGKLQKEKK